MEYREKLQDLERRLREYGEVAVSFSGGVDSTFLLLFAKKVLGENLSAAVSYTHLLTDDLAMEGVQGYSGEENIAVSAIQAGNDLLCTSRYAEQIPAVVQAVRDGKISEKQITDSALRVLRWKEKLGLFEEKE